MAENRAIDWNNFEVEDISTLEKDTKGIYVVHFRNETCDDSCKKDTQTLAKYEAQFKSIDSQVQIKSAKLSEEAAKDLGVKESSSIFVFYHGHLLRVDNNGPVVHPKSTDQYIKDILSKKPIQLTDLQELGPLFSGRDRAFVFYGDENSKSWKNVALTAKFVSHELYYTTDADIASELDLKAKNKFYSACKLGEKTIRLKGKLSPSLIERFVEMTEYPIPTRFTPEAYHDATSKGYPIMFIKTEDNAVQKSLQEIFTKHETAVRSHFLVFHLANLEEKEQKEVFEYCTPEDTPKEIVVCIVDYLSDHQRPPRYIFRKEVKEMPLMDFILGFISGSSRPYAKSEKLATKFSAKVRNLNSRSLHNFVTLDDTVKYVVVHFSTNSTSQADLHLVEEVSIEYTSPSVKFGRYNIDRNEKVEETEGLYFGGAWNHTELIKYEQTWTVKSIKQWIDQMVEEQDRIYSEMYGSTDL